LRNEQSSDGGLRCSFCNKSQAEVRKLIAGHGVYICNECVEICNEILTEEKVLEMGRMRESLPRPSEIKAFLDDYVIGQENAKRRIAVAVYNHYKRIEYAVANTDDVELTKSIRHSRRNHPDRSGLCRRGCREHPAEAVSERQGRRRSGAAGNYLHRRSRQDQQEKREPLDHQGRQR